MGDERERERGRGLRDEYPRPTGVGAATGIGALWGLFGYTVLWQGSPFGVSRAFVESAPGTLLLLPVRIVLSAIRFVETHVAGRTFDFSDDNWWIGLVAGALGAAIVLLAFLLTRTTVRRLRALR